MAGEMMGTLEEAERILEDKARAWRALRQPSIDTRAGHRETEAKEREARIRLAEAAVLWLWHRERNAASSLTLAMCGGDNGCEHDFGGFRPFPDGNGGEQFCRKCGLGAMAHTLHDLP